MKLNLKTTLVFAFQILLILVPLTWTASTSELFEFPKMLLTYAFTIVIAGLWLARMVSEKRIIYRRTFFELPLLLFLASQTIATLFSIDIHTSLFGYYSRFNGGLLSLISYILLYFAAVSNFDRDDAKNLIKTLILTAGISSLYAFPEHFGHSPSCLLITGTFNAKCWVQDVQYRVFGTFGQPNWLAAYLVAILPITLFSSVFTKNTTHRAIYAGLTLLFLLTMIFTKSQSGLGALAVVLCLDFIIISFQIRQKKLILGLIPLFALVFIVKHTAVMNTLDSLNNINPFYSTTAAIVAKDNNTLTQSGTDSMIIRRVVWQGAWTLALKHPFFGTGVETFAYSYYNVRPVEHNLISEWDFLYNKAHNEFLNYAATTGFIGLGTYLLFLGAFVYWCLKNSLSDQKSHQSLVTKYQSLIIPALLSGFIGLCISNFFGFSTVPVNTLLFLFPALALLINDQKNSPITKDQGPITSLDTILYLAIGTIVFLLLLAVNRGLTADIEYNTGKNAESQHDFQTAVGNLQNAVKTVPDEPLYTDELSLTASEVAESLALNNQPSQASEAAQIAIELSNRTLNLNKVHLNFYKTRAKVFINLTPINPGYGVEAAATLDAAIHLAPTDAKLWFNRALLTEQLGFKPEAAGIFAQTIALKPNYELARYQYGLLLEQLGHPDQAAAQYAYSLKYINPNNPQMAGALAAVATESAALQTKKK